MVEKNFADFMKEVLEGIGYGNLSHTNRAYQWMKNCRSTDGPCIKYLMNNITEENFVTQKEMSLFKELQSTGNLPSESEIDEALAKYFDDSATTLETFSLNCLENELKQADAYHKELELEEKLLLRQCNKLQAEANALENRNKNDGIRLEKILNQTEEINSSYNEMTRKVENDLSKISSTFAKLLDENVPPEEHNIFRINFEIFKEINSTFREAVTTVLQKSFSRGLKSKSVEDKTNEASDSGIDCSTLELCSVDEWKKKVEYFILVTSRLGTLHYQHSKYECEELELNELKNYIVNLMKDVDSKNMSVARLESQNAINLEMIDNIQKSIYVLSEKLERHYISSVANDLVIKERLRVEHKLKSDRKCLHKIADLCIRFVDLMTLQTCLLQNEKENVDSAISLYHYGVDMLEDQYEKHSNTMTNLRQMLKNQKLINHSQNETIDSVGEFSPDVFNSTKSFGDSYDTLVAITSCPRTISDSKHNILEVTEKKLNGFIAFKTQLEMLHKVIFDGPLHQPFFCASIMNYKGSLDEQCSDYVDKLHSWKLKYNDELEKLTTDEYLKMKKMLGFTFLTNPLKLRNDLKMLRSQLSDFSKSTTLNLRKGDTSLSESKKQNLSSRY